MYGGILMYVCMYVGTVPEDPIPKQIPKSICNMPPVFVSIIRLSKCRSLHIYMYVCMCQWSNSVYACTVCMDALLHVYAKYCVIFIAYFIHTYIHTYVLMHINLYANECMYVCLNTLILSSYTYTYTCTCTYPSPRMYPNRLLIARVFANSVRNVRNVSGLLDMEISLCMYVRK